MREPPWLAPRSCAGPNFSSPRTRRPRAARWYAAALPMPPSPTTITSLPATSPASMRPMVTVNALPILLRLRNKLAGGQFHRRGAGQGEPEPAPAALVRLDPDLTAVPLDDAV